MFHKQTQDRSMAWQNKSQQMSTLFTHFWTIVQCVETHLDSKISCYASWLRNTFILHVNTLTEKCDMAHQHLRQFESVYYALQKFYQDTTVTVTVVKVGFTNGYKEIR